MKRFRIQSRAGGVPSEVRTRYEARVLTVDSWARTQLNRVSSLSSDAAYEALQDWSLFYTPPAEVAP